MQLSTEGIWSYDATSKEICIFEFCSQFHVCSFVKYLNLEILELLTTTSFVTFQSVLALSQTSLVEGKRFWNITLLIFCDFVNFTNNYLNYREIQHFVVKSIVAW